jgi:diguanylate cyclase (GGDEF)-like protein
MRLDRSPAATILLAGARQLAALLPLLALGALRLLPELGAGTPLPWVEPALVGPAALLAAAALVPTVADALRSGRARSLADAVALGAVGVTLGTTLLTGSDASGPGVAAGLATAGVLFAAGSFAGDAALGGRGARIAAGVAAFIALEACLGLVLVAGGAAVDDRIRPLLLLAPALALGIAAVTGGDAPWRTLALGLAATSTLGVALAATSLEALVGPAGIGAAAAVLGAGAAARLWRSDEAASPVALIGRVEADDEPEFSDAERLARELRATIEELIATRRTVELQRAEIDRASAVDRLTGVSSRGAILDRLSIETAEARRYDHPLAAVLLDVDGFADFNHAHGVDAGDALLREVALRLRLRIREADALGRIGADAFLAVLPHTDERGAIGFAEAVRSRLAARPMQVGDGEAMVTVSVGVALMRPLSKLSADELLAAAEEALASARAAGGNRIAFDRAHGLARLEERAESAEPAADEAADATR